MRSNTALRASSKRRGGMVRTGVTGRRTVQSEFRTAVPDGFWACAWYSSMSSFVEEKERGEHGAWPIHICQGSPRSTAKTDPSKTE